MKTLPLRLAPGKDLRSALEAAVQSQICRAAFVRTTAEVLLALLPEWEFARAPDPTTGFDEKQDKKKPMKFAAHHPVAHPTANLAQGRPPG